MKREREGNIRVGTMKKLVWVVLLAVTSGLAQQQKATADSKPASGTVTDGITREQASEILIELKAIRQLLEKQSLAAKNPAPQQAPAPQKVSIKLNPNWTVLGKADAPVTVVEFSDYQCPYCRRYYNTIFNELKKNYIDTGKVRYIIRDFPLPFHNNAAHAALAAHCAGEQGETQFWALRNLMLQQTADIGSDSIIKYGTQVDLDMSHFKSCLDSKKYDLSIQQDVAAADRTGVNATPSFVIGKTRQDQIDGTLTPGAMQYPEFEAAIQNEMPKVAVIGRQPAPGTDHGSR